METISKTNLEGIMDELDSLYDRNREIGLEEIQDAVSKLSDPVDVNELYIHALLNYNGIGDDERIKKLISKDSKEKSDKTRNLIRKDSLTGLDNRGAYEHDLPGMVFRFYKDNKDGEMLAMYCFDINKFKNINDTYGHKFGDVVIKAAAYALDKMFERKLVSRNGGDEFMVVDKNYTIKSEGEIEKDLEKKSRVLNHLVSKYIEESEYVEGKEEYLDDVKDGVIESVNLSMGLALGKEGLELTETEAGQYGSSLEIRADKAMYYAKNNPTYKLFGEEKIKLNYHLFKQSFAEKGVYNSNGKAT